MKKLLWVLPLFLVLALASGVQAQATHSTVFTWTASTSTGATYNAYKQAACAGPFVKINTAPITGLTFTDSGMADGETNCYLFTAVIVVAGTTSESLQTQSEIAKIITPVSPTVTPGTAFVAPPTKPIAKVS